MRDEECLKSPATQRSLTRGSAAERLFLRCDGGLAMGMGHVARCLALAEAWGRAGGNATFLVAAAPERLTRRIAEAGFDVRTLPLTGKGDAAEALRMASPEPGSWFVLDGYAFDGAYQLAVKAAGFRLLVIDDLAHLNHYDADVVVNQNIGAPLLAYNVTPSTRLLLGTRYALLRIDFLGWRRRRRRSLRIGHRVLVTLGGGETTSAAMKAVRALQRVEIKGLEAVVVLGDFSAAHELVKTAARQGHVPITVVQDTKEMPELMAWADLAVCAGGSTCWELAFMGVPNLILTLADNQRGIAEGLDSQGVSQHLGWHVDVGLDDVADRVEALLLDQSVRREMGRRGRTLVDGRGADRVVRALREQADGAISGR